MSASTITAPPGTQSAAEVIAAQRDLLFAMYRRHVGPGDSYALLDFPDHANVGDSAIWAGEVVILREITGRDPAYVCTVHNFDPADMAKRCPAGPIFLHGGGNLGDIWPAHQAFRERIIGEYRDRAVVQLPQSLHYRDESRAASFVAAVAGHDRFELWLRDAPSMDFATARLDCPVHLVPDSAFGLGAQPRWDADRRAIALLRTDSEAAAIEANVLAAIDGVLVEDWLYETKGFQTLCRIARKAERMTGMGRARLYQAVAMERIRRGLRQLSRGEQVVTDRLHAHILSTLLGIPHIVLDNEYGKIANYMGSWTGGCVLARRAHDAHEAAASLQEPRP